MKKLLSLAVTFLLIFSLAACSSRNQEPLSSVPGTSENESSNSSSSHVLSSKEPVPSEDLLIQVQTENGNSILFQLNSSTASNSLYQQLPLTVQIENYAGNEKIFYPDEKLDTSDTPLARGPAGTLAYYEPWGNIAIFYGECEGASGLYELGEIVSGAELIATLNGNVSIEQAKRETNASTPSPGSDPVPSSSEPLSVQDAPPQNKIDEIPQIQIIIGERSFSATLYDNESTRALLQCLPLTLSMKEMNGNEKYHFFSDNLPVGVTRPFEIHTGDFMLYGSNCLVLFYESFSTSYSYTPLGRIGNPDGLSQALGTGDAEVQFQIAG